MGVCELRPAIGSLPVAGRGVSTTCQLLRRTGSVRIRPLMKVATFNVNSLRKRLPIVLQWLERHQPDVLCLQETKVQDSEFPLAALATSGYDITFRG